MNCQLYMFRLLSINSLLYVFPFDSLMSHSLNFPFLLLKSVLKGKTRKISKELSFMFEPFKLILRSQNNNPNSVRSNFPHLKQKRIQQSRYIYNYRGEAHVLHLFQSNIESVTFRLMQDTETSISTPNQILNGSVLVVALPTSSQSLDTGG